MNTKGFTLLTLIIVVVIIGLLTFIAIPNFINMQTKAKEASVKSDCCALQQAVEKFGVLNGAFPESITDSLPDGKTVFDLLPEGNSLVNPFDKNLVNPVNGNAEKIGEIGYRPNCQDEVAVGYFITGVGKTAGTTIITLTCGP